MLHGTRVAAIDNFTNSRSTLMMRPSDVADMSWDRAIEAKFTRLASPILHGATQSVLDIVASLESEPDVGRLCSSSEHRAVDRYA